MSSPEGAAADEPLAAVDVELRRRILPYLARVCDELAVPIVYVTHDRAEVTAFAEEVPRSTMAASSSTSHATNGRPPSDPRADCRDERHDAG